MPDTVADRRECDVVVVGCGMAGLAAAVEAAGRGADVVVLEKTHPGSRGGQTRYAESFRVPSADCDLTPWGYEFAVPDYGVEDFHADVMDRTNGRADPDLARTLVERAGETVEWLTDLGVEWDMEPLAVGYTAARTWVDGAAMVDRLVEVAEERGATFVYGAEARELHQGPAREVTGVTAVVDDRWVRVDADAVVVAAGGYESSAEKRVRYYGEDYDAMKIRGSPYNTGEAIDMALDAGAKAVGQWGGAHMALIDAGAPDAEGGANRVDGYQYGLIVNREGERFVDEGEDARAHTYAKFGREIFEQPGRVAYVVVDAAGEERVRATGPSEPAVADDLPSLFADLDVDADRAVETVRAFNGACDPDRDAFDPDALDGNAATAVDPPKSNWALPLAEPPYYAYAVTGGITFAFGGVETTVDAEVVDTRDRVIPGLYAAGNSTGRLFYDNYPGGTGLTNAAVFGRIAGERAADAVGTAGG